MSAIVPDGATLRRELAGLCAASTDDERREAYARAAWSTLVEPGDGTAGSLVAALGAERALEVALSVRAPRPVGEITVQQLTAGRDRWNPRRDRVADAMERARKAGVRLLTPADADWPARSADLGPHAPLCLWTRGDRGLLSIPAPALALVGARASTTYGDFVAAELAAESAAAGVTVVSGGAYGIDGAAHRAAVAAGGATVAIMAGGVDRAYPAGHRDLIERIVREGLVVAEVPCGTTPTKFRFLARNRLIAALSDATVVVEAGWRSGAHNTAHHAQMIGRPVGVVPGPVTSAASMGCHRLLRESDATCVTTFAEVRELIGHAGSLEGSGRGDPGARDDEYTGDRTRILDALSARSPRTVADVARRAGFGFGEAAGLLGMLELDGAARRRGDEWIQASPAPPATLW